MGTEEVRPKPVDGGEERDTAGESHQGTDERPGHGAGDDSGEGDQGARHAEDVAGLMHGAQGPRAWRSRARALRPARPKGERADG